ncbi:ABC transporter permease [Ureaplasma diversum]|uniref:Efflux ABC transporter, permease protein n=1 Tax=Ureaplasma diversum NCTC 246 TaxID=1188241 RepID=A0A084F075_9BACT|nr:ABC transporter permease [Ureaplasma diversum]KEZ23617.1 efflux ABC transporter, permease protein [Ureaplasma diversum NCTC 246]
MKKLFCLMKSMLKLFFKNKALITQLSILMIVTTLVITTATITIQRLDKAQNDIKKVSLTSDYVAVENDANSIVFNDLEIVYNKLANPAKKIVKLHVFNKARLARNNNYIKLKPTNPKSPYYWPMGVNETPLNLSGNVDWNAINNLQLETVFWFNDGIQTAAWSATNYENFIYQNKNNKVEFVGVQDLGYAKVLFNSDDLSPNANKEYSTYSVNMGIVQANQPFAKTFDFSKHNLNFSLNENLRNPFLINNVNFRTNKIQDSTSNLNDNKKYLNSYESVYKQLTQYISTNTTLADYYEFDLFVDTSKLTNEYALFATYLQTKHHPDQIAKELKIDNLTTKYNDLFRNKVYLPTKIVDDPTKLEDVISSINKAKTLMIKKIKDETRAFFNNSKEQSAYSKQEQINLLNKIDNYNNQLFLLDKQSSEYSKISTAKRNATIELERNKNLRFLADQLKDVGFLSILDQHDIYYKKHQSANYTDVKTNTNFIATNITNPTYYQSKVVDDKTKWINQPVSLDEKYADSQNANNKYKRLYFDNDDATKISRFKEYYLNYYEYYNTIWKTYAANTNNQVEGNLVDSHDYTSLFNPASVGIYQLHKFFEVLFNEAEWLLSEQYLANNYIFSLNLYRLLLPFKDGVYQYKLTTNYKNKTPLVAVYKDYDDKNNKKYYYFEGYGAGDQAFINVVHNKDLPKRIELVNIVNKSDFNTDYDPNSKINVDQIVFNQYVLKTINFNKGYSDFSTASASEFINWSATNPDEYKLFTKELSRFFNTYAFVSQQSNSYSFYIEARLKENNILFVPFNINVINRSSDLAFVSNSYLAANSDPKQSGYKKVANLEDFKLAAQLPYINSDSSAPYIDYYDENNQLVRKAKDYRSWLRYVVPEYNKVDINGQIFFIIGNAESSEFLFPASNVNDILIDPKKTSVLYLGASGFDKLRAIAPNVPLVEYYSIKANAHLLDIAKQAKIFNGLKSQLNASKQGSIYKKSDQNHPFPIYKKRSYFLDDLRKIILIIAISLTALILILGIYFISSSLRNLVSKNQSMFGVLQAQGVSRTRIWLAFMPFYTIPSLLVLVISYTASYFLQPLVMRLFYSYWLVPIPAQYVSVGWIFAIPIAMTITLGLISFLIIFRMLAKSPYNTMRGDAGFKINKAVLAIKSIFIKFGAISVLRATYVIANFMRMLILLIIASSFSIIASIIATTKDTFTKSANITNELREYKYAVDLYSPTEQGGFYYISQFKNLGARNEFSPFPKIINDVNIKLKLRSLANEPVIIQYLNSKKELVSINSIIDQNGNINFNPNLLDKDIYEFSAIYWKQKNNQLIKIINKNQIANDLKIIDLKNKGQFLFKNKKQYLVFNKQDFANLDQLVAIYQSKDKIHQIKASVDDQLVYFDLSSLPKSEFDWEIVSINNSSNTILKADQINIHTKVFNNNKNGSFVYNLYSRDLIVYFNLKDPKYFNQQVNLVYGFNGIEEKTITSQVDSSGFVSFDLNNLPIIYNNADQAVVYFIKRLALNDSNKTIIYDSNSNEFNNSISILDNTKYANKNKNNQQLISFDYLTKNRPLKAVIKQTRIVNNKPRVNTIYLYGHLEDSSTLIIDYNSLTPNYTYKVEEVYLLNSEYNIYLDDLSVIDKTTKSSLPYSTLQYNNAMRVIKNFGTANPEYGDLLANIYYPSISTQPEIMNNVNFFDGKIISKSSLDGNIDVTVSDKKLQFNPWIFAKNFLPSIAIAKAELNEVKLLDEAFKTFGYEIIDNKKVDKLYDVPTFNNDGIIRQISLWTKDGKAPKSLDDPNNFFVKKNDRWEINTLPGVVTRQGAAEFSPQFVRLITQIYTNDKTIRNQYKLGLKVVNIDDDKIQQPYTYVSGIISNTKKFANSNVKLIGIDYNKNKNSPNTINPYQQIYLINKDKENLIDLIKDEDINSDGTYNVIINQVVAQRYNLKVNDVFDLDITNHMQRLTNEFNDQSKTYSAKFKVVGISYSLVNQQMVINQKIANKLLGFYEYAKRKQFENGFKIIEERMFNGFFTKEDKPLFFDNLISFYAPSGLSPALLTWPRINLADPNSLAGTADWIFLISWDKINSILNGSFDPTIKTWPGFNLQNYAALLNKIIRIYGSEANLASFKDVDANIKNLIFANTIDRTSFSLLLIIILSILPSLVIIIVLIASTLANESQRLIAVMKILGMRDMKNVNNFMFVYPIVWLLNIIVATPLSFGIIYLYKWAVFSALNIVLLPVIPWWIFVISFGFVGLVLILAWLNTYYKTTKLNLTQALNETRT